MLDRVHILQTRKRTLINTLSLPSSQYCWWTCDVTFQLKQYITMQQRRIHTVALTMVGNICTVGFKPALFAV